MASYKVLRDFPHNGRNLRKGGTVELAARQARHRRIAGFIEPVKEEKPAAKQSSKKGKGEK